MAENDGNRLGARALAFWRRRSRRGKVALVVGAVILLLAVIGALSGENDEPKQAATSSVTTREAADTETKSAETKAEAPPGDNINYRSRQFVKELRGCQAGVAILASELQHAAERDLVTLSSETNSAKEICDNVRHNMVALDTDHFDDRR